MEMRPAMDESCVPGGGGVDGELLEPEQQRGLSGTLPQFDLLDGGRDQA